MPCEGEGEERGVEWVAAELCNWKACVRAIGGFQEGKGLGIDGFDGYLVKKAEEPEQPLLKDRPYKGASSSSKWWDSDWQDWSESWEA